MAACEEQGGHYGRQRLFGAIGWGVCSALAGAAIQHAGILAGFTCHAALMVVALGPTLRLPFGPLHAKLAARQVQQHGQHGKVGEQHGDWDSSKGGSAGSHSAAAGEGEEWAEPREVQRFDSPLEARSLLAYRHVGGEGQGPKAAAAAVPAGAAGLASEQHSAWASKGSGGSEAAAAPRQPEEMSRHHQQQGQAEVLAQLEQGPGQHAQQQGQPQPEVHFWAGVAQLLRNPEASIFLAMAVTMGFGVGNIEGYLFLYLDQLGELACLGGVSLRMCGCACVWQGACAG